VQLVEFSCSLVSHTTKICQSGSALVRSSVMEAAARDLKLLTSRLENSAEATDDRELLVLCQSCDEVADRLLNALQKILTNKPRQNMGKRLESSKNSHD
jgi:hypothetical protein